MFFSSLRFLLLFLTVLQRATADNLLSYATGQTGFVLGSAFGLPGTNATYDYVVAGGGTGGLAIATRLAEDPNVSVAVIEAGGFYEIDNGNLSVVPGYANFYTGADSNNYQPLVDWDFTTTPQAASPSACPLTLPSLIVVGIEQSSSSLCTWQDIGRLLCSKLSGVSTVSQRILPKFSVSELRIVTSPTVDSLQKWADEVGDQSYTWEQFLPYYKKSCNFTSANQALYTNATNKENPDHFDPAGGPLHISFSNYVDPFGTWAQKGFSYVGMNVTDGLNGGSLKGSAYATLTIDPRDGYRSSSEASFLQAALQNGTAPTVYKNSLAQRIIFNGTMASGVTVTTAGAYGIPTINYTLSARKEVIVSAGVFQSPQLLMVSGVGPKNLLSQYNIPVVSNLAGVGQNMWDHILFGTDYKVDVNTASAALNSPVLAAKGVAAYQQNASGPLSVFGAGYYGWEDLPQPYRSNISASLLAPLESNFPSDWPELEWLPVSAYLGFQRNRQKEDPKDGNNYATLNTGLVAPLSRGNVSISSSSMNDPPIINPNWLTDPTDQALAIQSFRRQREVWAYLATQGLTDGKEALPGLNVTSDADILTYIKASLIQIYHAAATCKMGASNDTMAVLDNQARVYGTQNLRVVDASSFPFLPPGHPVSTVYALAEKIAADILGNATPPPGYNLSGYHDGYPQTGAANVLGGGPNVKAATTNGGNVSARMHGGVSLVALIGMIGLALASY